METPRKRQSKCWGSVPHCLSDKKNIDRSFSFHDDDGSRKEENKFNFKEVIVYALKSLIQIK